MDIVRTATLQRLICDNVEGCPTVGFRVPGEEAYDGNSATAPDDETSAIIMKYSRDTSRPLNHVDLGTCDNSNDNNCNNKISYTGND